MRGDVRENTRRAAAAEAAHNHTRLALVSSHLLEEFGDWSGPFEMRVVESRDDGFVEIEFRRPDAAT